MNKTAYFCFCVSVYLYACVSCGECEAGRKGTVS